MSGIPPIPDTLRGRLRQARSVTVLTGAGISAESGVPTFREAQTGLWARFRPEDLATPEAFRRNPKLIWEWYAWRRARLAEVEPNAGHLALTRLERRVPRFVLATQNVDGLHQRAGSRNVLELHGNILRTRCFDEDRVVERWTDGPEVPPRCPECGGPLRPDVVWFGETLPVAALEAAQDAARTCDCLLVVGTSALVYPAAGLIDLALAAGACVVEVNPRTTPYTERVTCAISGPAGVVLPALID